ncbi:3-hydroxyacyl-CoA dehydrogenase family protein [Candidatus Palauibacter soopunensis]|uniref:3-hydroxyacyl-CoA dehydrogenase family protein n=1 Tax=Candidatus Palauibacter soopunensis TaxID=3056739 RepID=UPI0023974148|nr:3-hydroxyacyl-CoA dehydrogenase family protein [Candidatus Palauibacter soopunensis]MDE2877286.1 3-hydroxyacyl-CoA dehydrogenase family protein [Candidatus Palauibacter soopunensis]
MTARPALAVLGAGTMGHGIAQVAAMAGYDTRLFDVMPDVLETARERIEANLRKGIQRGKVTPEARDRALDGLSYSRYLSEAAAGVGIAIEAVPEKLDLKQKVLARCAEAAADGALLATNTSSLSITALAEGLPSPDRVIGMHFFNPVHIMALVEIVRGAETSDETVATAREVAERLGKTPIVIADSPGFASSRLGLALGLEAIRMVEEGVASAEDIDTAMMLGYRHPMGPLKLGDLVGLDVRLDIARYLHEALGSPVFEPPALLERMVAAGRLGRKSGRGFYRWD